MHNNLYNTVFQVIMSKNDYQPSFSDRQQVQEYCFKYFILNILTNQVQNSGRFCHVFSNHLPVMETIFHQSDAYQILSEIRKYHRERIKERSPGYVECEPTIVKADLSS